MTGRSTSSPLLEDGSLLNRLRRIIDAFARRPDAVDGRSTVDAGPTALATGPKLMRLRTWLRAIVVQPHGRGAANQQADGATPTASRAASDRDEAFDGRPPQTAGEFRDFTFTCDAGKRNYKLFLPTARPSQSMPLVVMLHGCKQTPDDLAIGTRMNDFAQRDGFAVAYPAQSRGHNPSRCWNWFNPADQVRDRGEPAIIAGLTLELVRIHRFDAGRVYIAGLSAGGSMALILRTTYPELYAAVGVHSGVPPGIATGVRSALAAMRNGAGRRADTIVTRDPPDAVSGVTPIIVFHGDADTTVNLDNATEAYSRSVRTGDIENAPEGDVAHEVVKTNSVPGGHSYTRTSWARAGGEAMAELWVVHGAGHAWSGGDRRGSFTDPLGPDATAEMLRFFYRHRIRR